MKHSISADLEQEIFKIDEGGFEALALSVFQFQFRHNLTYNRYCSLLKIDPETISSICEIPFLPIEFFKSKEIKSGNFVPETIFESSGTTGSINSRHFVKHTSIYEKSFITTFKHFYGDEKNWCILGLLPSYLEKGQSSLVYMVDHLIRQSSHKESGFYLYDFEKLRKVISTNEANQQPTLLIGVTYALLDFAEAFPMPLEHTVVMETGGMKGRRQELVREQVHQLLEGQFSLSHIHSEYGMTELLSQAYSAGQGIYKSPTWMKILLRDEDDPFAVTRHSDLSSTAVSGAINVIDLANIHSCSFIATDDAGKLYADGSFEVLGRMDNSDIRGCGLMVL